MPPARLPDEMFQVKPGGGSVESSDTLEKLHVQAGLGAPGCRPGRGGGGGESEVWKSLLRLLPPALRALISGS